MPRYIDAELFSKNLMMQVYLADDEDFTKAFVKGMELVKKAEEETPTADVQEVRRGKWIIDEDGVVICSECGEEHMWDDFRPTYCDMCGAKMEDGRRQV
jgi:hypothetical protein